MKKKLRASTLIEAIVALVIIMLVFSIIMNFYLRQVKSSSQLNKLNIHFILNKIVNNEDVEQLYNDTEYKFESFMIKKTVSQYKNKENLFLLKYECLDTNKTILLQKRKVMLKIE